MGWVRDSVVKGEMHDWWTDCYNMGLLVRYDTITRWYGIWLWRAIGGSETGTGMDIGQWRAHRSAVSCRAASDILSLPLHV